MLVILAVLCPVDALALAIVHGNRQRPYGTTRVGVRQLVGGPRRATTGEDRVEVHGQLGRVRPVPRQLRFGPRVESKRATRSRRSRRRRDSCGSSGWALASCPRRASRPGPRCCHSATPADPRLGEDKSDDGESLDVGLR